MAQPYIGEIRMFAGSFNPAGWKFCDGQLLPISENETLFSLIGTTYGGDGQSTFALPDLRGRIPIHQGNGFTPAETGGAEEITLTVPQIAAHSHPLLASTSVGTATEPTSNITAASTGTSFLYFDGPPSSNMSPLAVAPVGGSQPHTNYQLPSLTTNHYPLTTIMADPFVAEIRIFPFDFAPRGWAFCNGQLLPLSQNTALFSLLGTFYGGNGKSNFALPDLRDRAPMMHGQGPGLSNHFLGEEGGSETVTLLESETPVHTHTMRAIAIDLAELTTPTPTTSLAISRNVSIYNQTNQNIVALAPEALVPAGGDQAHNNLQPYLTLNFCIALQGVYPPRE